MTRHAERSAAAPRARAAAGHIASLALAGLLIGAAPDPTRNTLPPPPPTRIAHPDALFLDDFSDGKLDGWAADRPGVWSIWHGVLRGDLPDAKQERSFIYAGAESWTDYVVDLDVCGIRGVDKGVAVRVTGSQGVGVDLRAAGYQDVVMYRGDWPMGHAPVINANGAWQHLRVEARGHRYRVWVNGALALDKQDPHKAFPNGRIALPAYTGGIGQCTVYYDNVVVTPVR
ncbi:MAG: DUF1080 domain-containing protein [Candidatus Eisenbacteria bacterium]|nr:DUF1080 domain-containing protein [Candidatus Eisenbacteria bacterium]